MKYKFFYYFSPALFLLCTLSTSQPIQGNTDSELTNYRSGISAIWQGSKGKDYYEEYFYHDKLINDAKVVYIKSSTPISLEHNERNTAFFHRADGGNQIIGVHGLDGIPKSGDEGIIRYKLDRDRQLYLRWAANGARTNLDQLAPAFEAPFALDEIEYEPGIPVVGTTGHNGMPKNSRTDRYYRGAIGPFGDEWHVLTYADDDWFLRTWNPENFVDQKFLASDAKTVLLVVNPKTPCLTLRATGTAQFYTTPPKAYWTPKINQQTTYFSNGSQGQVSFEIRDINENTVYYRINKTNWNTNNTSSVYISSDEFSNGSNTLEYYYEGNQNFTKTRIVIKDPTHPSKTEPHGNFIWKNDEGFSLAKFRVQNIEPYKSLFRYFSGFNDFSMIPVWEENYRNGTKDSGPTPLKTAFVALVNGWNYKAEGAAKTHGIYAKEMVLQNRRALDPVGFEYQMSSDASGNRELHAFGYYDTSPVLRALFAYDILVANFRDDQVEGGITAVEDYFVRDCFANFAYEAMQWSANMTGLGPPGMWGGARIMGAVSIGIVMSEYSTPYYGTSGFGSIEATFPMCPYDDDQLTWKQALLKTDYPTSEFPNYSFTNGITSSGTESLFLSESEPFYGETFPDGTWQPKRSYFSYGLMGFHIANFAHMVTTWTEEPLDPLIVKGLIKATDGTFIGARDQEPRTGGRHHLITLINDDWPSIRDNNREWVKNLPDSDNNSATKAMQDASVWGFALYDDGSRPFVPSAPSGLSTKD